ncbi:MAG: cupredoxin domain-containing protein [Bacteroidetes bacterium]|nr:cupredoxin domain-containing protein [Bacteroidota bacterium]
MKSNFTKTGLNLLIVVTLLLTNIATAQTLVDVTVSSNVFTSSSITINAGDTVRWTNTGGSHNVNGTTETFSSNPESFGNAIATEWVYTFVFTAPGTYNYQCDVHVGSGMIGDITVLSDTGIEDNSEPTNKAISNIYPVPASEYVVIELSQELLLLNTKLTVVIYDLTGREIARDENIRGFTLTYDTESWSNSMYIFHLLSDTEIIETGKIIMQ